MNTYVRYSEFGAKGDGSTDDFDAIVKTHEYANEHSLPVKADEGAVYYIGISEKTAEIKTDTDWTGAEFIVDDSLILPGEAPNNVLFSVPQEIFRPEITSLKKGQKTLSPAPGKDMVVTVWNENIKQYKRKMTPPNPGTAMTDTFIVKADGTIVSDIIWDFDEITETEARTIEPELTIRGGHFITKANHGPQQFSYYYRGIAINRTGVTVRDLRHDVIEEGPDGCPYVGFILVSGSANFRIENVHLCPHKIYYNGAKGDSHEGMGGMGSYDIQINYTANVTLINLTQDNINDETRWGLMCTNFCKDITIDGCVISRFDAHMGVTNCRIRNSSLGWMTVHLIGHGIFEMDRCDIYGRFLIELREDYGSTFDGDMFIRDCTWYQTFFYPVMIFSRNCGVHDFGYECMMPKNIVIENLRIADLLHVPGYVPVRIFNDYDNHKELEKTFRYHTCENFIMRGLRVDSGRKCTMYGDPELFKDINFDIDEESMRFIEMQDKGGIRLY